jgi:hypothetical protein
VTPLPGRRAAAHLAPARPLGALGAVGAFMGISVALPWIVGQATGDRWVWSQWIFWVPAWIVALWSAATWWVAHRWGRRGPVRRAALAMLASAAAWAGARSAWTEFGWMPARPGSAPAGGVVVTHWNPQWPGERALEVGHSLVGELGDVAIITSPGSLLRKAVRDEWLPSGYRAVDLGSVAIVSRLPVSDARIVASAALGPAASAWIAWFRVELPAPGGSLGVLAVDLPSQVFLARSEVAEALRRMLAGASLPDAPDIVLGDLNSTPGSTVWRAVEELGVRAPAPWHCSGWLCTYRRPWPLVRIDAMFAGPRLAWHGWRSIDLGTGKHRAQQGVLAVAPGG